MSTGFIDSELSTCDTNIVDCFIREYLCKVLKYSHVVAVGIIKNIRVTSESSLGSLV